MIGPRRILAGLQRRLARVLRPPARPWKETRSSEQVTVSVVVPVKDAGSDLEPMIARTKEQTGFRSIEIVIVDSGSTDGSAETAERMGATVVRIPAAEFSHSGARNLGAERATGDYVLFTVQDARPSSTTWLREMFSGLQRHEAAAVSCGEEPRPDSDLFYRVISWNHHRFMAVDGGDRLMSRPVNADDPVERRKNAQISDTACLVARELFLRYRHRGEYAEDLDLGLRLIDDGYRLAFLTGPRIVHSHNRPAWYHLKRSYVEHQSLFEMLPGYPGVADDAAVVARDIASSCAGLDALVGEVLPALPVPCSPQDVRAAAAGPGPAVSASAPPAPDFLDVRTRAFVGRLSAAAGTERGDSVRGGGALAGSAAAIAGLICDYLEHTGRVVDGALLDEIKAALYKGWALHVGVGLASVYGRGRAEVGEPLRDILEELTKGV